MSKLKYRKSAEADLKNKIQARIEDTIKFPKTISELKKLKPGTKMKMIKGNKNGLHYGRFKKNKEYILLQNDLAFFFQSEVGTQLILYPKKQSIEFTPKGFILKPQGLAVKWTPEEFEFTKIVV